jgi:hypothetical protein
MLDRAIKEARLLAALSPACTRTEARGWQARNADEYFLMSHRLPAVIFPRVPNVSFQARSLAGQQGPDPSSPHAGRAALRTGAGGLPQGRQHPEGAARGRGPAVGAADELPAERAQSRAGGGAHRGGGAAGHRAHQGVRCGQGGPRWCVAPPNRASGLLTRGGRLQEGQHGEDAAGAIGAPGRTVRRDQGRSGGGDASTRVRSPRRVSRARTAQIPTIHAIAEDDETVEDISEGEAPSDEDRLRPNDRASRRSLFAGRLLGGRSAGGGPGERAALSATAVCV